jgi:hypothetical protein
VSVFFFFKKCYSIVQVRVQAIRGLPLFCKDTPEHIAKIVDILVQLLAAGKLLLCIVYSVVFFSCCFMQLQSQQFTFLFLVGGWGEVKL